LALPSDHCCPIWIEFFASHFDLGTSPVSQNQIHHRGTEDTEREIYFLVYREIPIDEKNLAEGG